MAANDGNLKNLTAVLLLCMSHWASPHNSNILPRLLFHESTWFIQQNIHLCDLHGSFFSLAVKYPQMCLTGMQSDQSEKALSLRCRGCDWSWNVHLIKLVCFQGEKAEFLHWVFFSSFFLLSSRLHSGRFIWNKAKLRVTRGYWPLSNRIPENFFNELALLLQWACFRLICIQTFQLPALIYT